MKRIVFGVWFFFIVFFLNLDIIFCVPQLYRGFLNEKSFFYGSDVQKILVESDLHLLINNFDEISFNLVKYLKYDNSRFNNHDPRNHINLMLELKNQYLNYYYSFPFSHDNKLNYYEYLYYEDWCGGAREQYWRPCVGVHNKNSVIVNKFNINPDNYMLKTDLKYKICQLIKFYTNTK